MDEAIRAARAPDARADIVLRKHAGRLSPTAADRLTQGAWDALRER
jgi:hypothetical protein